MTANWWLTPLFRVSTRRQSSDGIVYRKRKTMRYRLSDLDLRFCPRKEVCDKTMEREINCPWCDLAQDRTSLLDNLVQGSCVEDHVIRKWIGATRTVTLTMLTHKDHLWQQNSLQQYAFTTLLTLFQQAPVLHLPEIHHPFTLMTDISLLASGGILMQTNDNSDLHPCAYLSQTFSPMECNYDIYNCELLAIICALDHWHQYLQGTDHPVTLLTDHKNLMYFCQPQKLSCRQACWMLFLQDFDLIFVHTPGAHIVLHGLHNLISSSAHSSVVRGHIEFLGVCLEGNLVMRSWWDLSHTGSPREETRLLCR